MELRTLSRYMSSVKNAFTATKYYKTITTKYWIMNSGNGGWAPWKELIDSIWFLLLYSQGVHHMKNSQRKHQRALNRTIGWFTYFFLTPSRKSVKVLPVFPFLPAKETNTCVVQLEERESTHDTEERIPHVASAMSVSNYMTIRLEHIF